MVHFIRVPYYIGDLKRGPNLENYPCAVAANSWAALFVGQFLLGGSWVDIHGVISPLVWGITTATPLLTLLNYAWSHKSPSIGYNYSYPTYKPT